MAGASFLPPGGPMEIVFSFDTTGSMSSILEEVQGRVQDMIQRLQADIHGIRIGVIAHGDYCDEKVFYLTNKHDFSSNVADLCDFVKGVTGTGGGDPDECYELVLRMVREQFSWTAGTQKILVIIGDANPHEPDYDLNTDNIDWREEVDLLKQMGVKIYGVQAFDNEGVDDFYKTIANRTDGHYIKLGQFSNIVDFLMAICYRERGEDLFTGYEMEVRARDTGVNKELDNMFGKLRKTNSSGSVSSSLMASKLTPIISSPKRKPSSSSRRSPKHSNRVDHKPKRIRPAKQSLRKDDKSTSPIVHREKVPHASFKHNGLNWSQWRLAYHHCEDTDFKTKGFTKLERGTILRKTKLFKDASYKATVYEVSVQTKKYGKRHVMYTKTVVGKDSKTDWEHTLLFGGKKRLRNQISCVVRQGCSVFVRRALIINNKTHKSLDNDQSYDYAWNKTTSRKHHRLVQKDDIVISGDAMEE